MSMIDPREQDLAVDEDESRGLREQVAAQLGSLKDVLVVADALHAQTGNAELLAAGGGQLMVAVKANQPTLYTQLKALPWAQVPIGCQTRETGHGRKETRTVKAVTVATPAGSVSPTRSKPSGSPEPVRSRARPAARRRT